MKHDAETLVLGLERSRKTAQPAPRADLRWCTGMVKHVGANQSPSWVVVCILLMITSFQRRQSKNKFKKMA